MLEIIIALTIFIPTIIIVWGILHTKRQVSMTNPDLSSTRYTELKGSLNNLAEIERLVHAQQKIAAIKEVRNQLQLNLKDAKWFVDTLETELRGVYGSIHEPYSSSTMTGMQNDPDSIDLNAITHMLATRGKINAIKLYREQTGVGLKEAKEAVEALEDQQRGLYVSESAGQRQDFVDPDELRRLLSQGNKIQAIKYYRQCTGVGLKEAKDAVEYIAAQRSSVMDPPQTMI